MIWGYHYFRKSPYLANWLLFHHPTFSWNKAFSLGGVPLLPWKLVWIGYSLTRYMCLVSIKTLYWRMVPPPFLTGYPYNGYRTPLTIWVDHHPYHRKTMVCKLRVFQTHTSHPDPAREVPTKTLFVFLKPSLFFEVFFVSVRFMIPKHPPTTAKVQPFYFFLGGVVEGQQSTNFTPDWRIQVKEKQDVWYPNFLLARFLKHQFLSVIGK